MECTHLLDNVKVDSDLITEDTSATKNWVCSECSVKDQNWLCLQCGAVNCGRYASAHAKQHAETFGHQLCMSCDEYSVYCYKCDDYVSNDTEHETIDKVRKCIMQIRGDANSNIGNEENSKDGSDGQNSCASNTSIQEPTSTSGEAGIMDTTNATESSELDKRNKNAKTPEETVRSLRPRSRKRSHSDDSSSTENGTAKSKEKKGSPCNGNSPREKKVVGLKNLGNTCFMNAVLQSLSNIQEFSCYFSQLPVLEPKTNGRKVYHSRSYTRQEMTDVVMAEELRKVLINLNSGCGGKGAISPECLFLVIWKVVPRFRGYQQQDAHEFLRYMLDRLHTELQQLLPSERAEAGAAASIVTAVFGGTLQSEVRCLACGAESKKLDPFLDLSLELPDVPASAPVQLLDCLASFVQMYKVCCLTCGAESKLDPFLDLSLELPDAPASAPVQLLDCLASFVQVEELADTERYFCGGCQSRQKSTKQFRVRRLPQVLCLHLKRFRWNNYFRTKVDTVISFPLRALDMSRFVLERRRPQLYDLAAVIVHHGSGAGSGHYTAFAINSGQWFHFNDQTVRAADADAVQACKPYILFYIRRDLAQELS